MSILLLHSTVTFLNCLFVNANCLTTKGGGGAAVFPFAVGAIAQAKGVQVLQPIVLSALIVILILWCLLPGGFRKRGLEEASMEIERHGRDGSSRSWAGKRLDRLKGGLRHQS